MKLEQPEFNPTSILDKFDQLIEENSPEDAPLALLAWLYIAKQYHAHGSEELRDVIEQKYIAHQLENFRKRKKNKEENSAKCLNDEIRMVLRRAKLMTSLSDTAMIGGI